MSDIGILSIGYTRSLWDSGETNDNVRMRAYAGQIGRYAVIVNSRKVHSLRRLQVASNFVAVPSDGFCALDNFARLFWLAAREARTGKYHVIQAQDPLYTGIPALLVGRIFGLNVNVCVYGPDPYDAGYQQTSWLSRLFSFPARCVLRFADAIQVDGLLAEQSLGSKAWASGKVRRKPMVPADLGRFLDLPVRSAAYEAGCLRLLFVGRLVAQKNIELLLRVVARMGERTGAGVALTIVGDGPSRAALERTVAQLGIGARVTFRGQLPRQAVTDAFAAADVFVLSSSYEGFPRVLMEAAAAGLPIVTTPIGGADEIVSDGQTGFIVERDDDSGFVAALTRLLSDSASRIAMGAAGRERVRGLAAQYSDPRKQVQIWEDIVSQHERTRS